MRKNFRLFAAAIVLVFASSAAHAFVLEAKGPAAKWRTDLTKRNNKYTACLLGAWNKAEIAAAKAELAAENAQMLIDGYGKNGALCTAAATPLALCTGLKTMDQTTYRNAIGLGSQVDIDLLANPVTANPGSELLPADLTALNDKITLSCNPIVAQADEPGKGKGLNAANPIAVSGGFSLADIGCLGDCSTSGGTQACASTDAYKTNVVIPQNNARATAAGIASIIPLAQLTSPTFCGGQWPDPTGTEVNLGTTGVVKYVEKVGACVQKCQDDFISGAKSKGNGFENDTTNCILNAAGTGALVPVGDGVPFDTCVAAAHLATLGNPGYTGTAGWTCLNSFLSLGAGLGTIDVLIAGATSIATNSNYDRGDLESGFIAGVLGVAMPSQAPSMGARATSNIAHAYGSCANFGNSVIEDYEECEPGISTLCPSIPGTAQAGGAPATCTGSKTPFFCCTGVGTGPSCTTCPAVDNTSAKQLAGRCAR